MGKPEIMIFWEVERHSPRELNVELFGFHHGGANKGSDEARRSIGSRGLD